MTNIKKVNNTELTKLDQFQSVEEMKAWAITILDSGLLPSSINSPEEVITIVQHGKELGLTPHIALNNIHVIQGRPTMSSTMLGALLKKRGIEWRWDEDFDAVKGEDGKAQKLDDGTLNRRTTIHFFWMSQSLGREMDATHSVTWAQMALAGYVTKDNWTKYPKEMLRARCMAYAVRALFPEVLSGFYTELEMNDLNGNNKVEVSEEGDLKLNIDISNEQ